MHVGNQAVMACGMIFDCFGSVGSDGPVLPHLVKTMVDELGVGRAPWPSLCRRLAVVWLDNIHLPGTRPPEHMRAWGRYLWMGCFTFVFFFLWTISHVALFHCSLLLLHLFLPHPPQYFCQQSETDCMSCIRWASASDRILERKLRVVVFWWGFC